MSHMDLNHPERNQYGCLAKWEIEEQIPAVLITKEEVEDEVPLNARDILLTQAEIDAIHQRLQIAQMEMESLALDQRRHRRLAILLGVFCLTIALGLSSWMYWIVLGG